MIHHFYFDVRFMIQNFILVFYNTEVKLSGSYYATFSLVLLTITIQVMRPSMYLGNPNAHVRGITKDLHIFVLNKKVGLQRTLI